MVIQPKINSKVFIFLYISTLQPPIFSILMNYIIDTKKRRFGENLRARAGQTSEPGQKKTNHEIHLPQVTKYLLQVTK